MPTSPATACSTGEGSFLACTFWLTDALHGIGHTDEATALFERLLQLRDDLGLLSEEYDKYPQAFNMVGLVNTARHLDGIPITTHAPPRPDLCGVAD